MLKMYYSLNDSKINTLKDVGIYLRTPAWWRLHIFKNTKCVQNWVEIGDGRLIRFALLRWNALLTNRVFS